MTLQKQSKLPTIPKIRNLGKINMNISATELNKRPGAYLSEAIREPVVIEKSGKPTAVLLSYDRFMELEDAYWGEKALRSDQERSLSSKQSHDFLKDD